MMAASFLSSFLYSGKFIAQILCRKSSFPVTFQGVSVVSEKINWYPGHMEKAIRRIEEKLKIIDAVIELRDARIPVSSSNPRLEDMLLDQELLVVLNKRDLANEKHTEEWIEFLSQDYSAFACSSTEKVGCSRVAERLKNIREDFLKRKREKGLTSGELKVLVVGVPNCGKSTFINAISRRGGVKTGKKPGVTRGHQWLKIEEGIRVMDTPGLLWPDIEDEEQGYKLAMCGSVRPEVVDTELLACRLLDCLRQKNPAGLKERYNIEISPGDHSYDLLADIGRRRGCLVSGGQVDRERAGNIVLKEFQSGQLGRVSLESVEDIRRE